MENLQKALDWLGNSLLTAVLPAAVILVAGIFVIRIVTKLVAKGLEKTKFEKAAHNLIKTVIRVVLYSLLILIVASRLGIDVTGVVALASVLTLAVSLSVQNALTNLISGFTLLYTDPFSSGDYVEVAGQAGTVQEIGLTYTKLVTPDNKIVFIPNSAVTSAEIVNYTVTGTRRVSMEFGVSYDAPTQPVLDALLEAAQVPTILEDKPPFAALSSYGESHVTYVLHVWSTSADYWTTLFAINERVRQIFDERGIAMTYPHLNVHLDK